MVCLVKPYVSQHTCLDRLYVARDIHVSRVGIWSAGSFGLDERYAYKPFTNNKKLRGYSFNRERILSEVHVLVLCTLEVEITCFMVRQRKRRGD